MARFPKNKKPVEWLEVRDLKIAGAGFYRKKLSQKYFQLPAQFCSPLRTYQRSQWRGRGETGGRAHGEKLTTISATI